MSDHEYEERVIAFVDILGWSSATDDLSKFTNVREAVTLIASHARSFSTNVKKTLKARPGVPAPAIEEHASIEFSYFSDSFAVSAPIAHSQIVFKILSFASDNLLHKGFLVRGGVTIGKLYHRDGVIFGPALLEAVKLEGHDAVYPRLLCSGKLVEHLNCFDYKDNVVLQDCCHDTIVNVACGSLLARDCLMAIIRNQTHALESIIRKWRYMERMLPIMYDAKTET